MTDYARAVQLFFVENHETSDVCFGRADTYGELAATWCDEHDLPSQAELDDIWALTYPDGPSSFPSEADVNARLAMNNFGHYDLLADYIEDAEEDQAAVDAAATFADAKDAINRTIYRQILIMNALNAIDRFVDVGDAVPDELPM